MTQKRRTFKKSRHTSRSAATGEHIGPPPACIAFAASVFAPSIGKDASKVPSPNSLAFSRALASLASPASAITTILPSSLRLAPSHADFVDTPPRAKSSLVDARTPRTTDRHARVRGRDPSSSTRSSRARVCVPVGVAPFPRARRGRSPPPARALFPTSRALYRALSHFIAQSAASRVHFLREIFLGARLRGDSRVTTRQHAGVDICGCGGSARAFCAHPCAVRREVGGAWWSVAALSGTRAKAGRGRREDDARGMEEGVTSCLERCV